MNLSGFASLPAILPAVWLVPPVTRCSCRVARVAGGGGLGGCRICTAPRSGPLWVTGTDGGGQRRVGCVSVEVWVWTVEEDGGDGLVVLCQETNTTQHTAHTAHTHTHQTFTLV